MLIKWLDVKDGCSHYGMAPSYQSNTRVTVQIKKENAELTARNNALLKDLEARKVCMGWGILKIWVCRECC